MENHSKSSRLLYITYQIQEKKKRLMSINDTCKPLDIVYTLRLWRINGKVERIHSRKTRRIIAKVKADKFLKGFLCVNYGKAKTNTGKVDKITNSGTYETKKELLEALSAFTDKSLLEDTKKWINET